MNDEISRFHNGLLVRVGRSGLRPEYACSSHDPGSPGGGRQSEECRYRRQLRNRHEHGPDLRTDGVDIDLDSFIQGLKDGLQGLQPKFTEPQLKTAFEAFQADMQAKAESRAKALGAKNQREGQTFLVANRTKAGVKTTKSGLQYLVVRAGTGATPKATDTVKVHYEGFLIDGTVFDSSVKRKEPAVLQVDGVIPGWTEALQMMKTGDKWRLFVPAELAYGAAGADNAIGPNATLIFDVELLSVEPPATEALPDPSVPK
jgi:FKBP-type peptidyl-prolyl cis-trans isomerase FklB